ncbi:MAG: DUF4398 domain-containing protein [Sideroxydans sp.]|nr:DUF4398 domain-containing protein [Sideroxydans sp.]NOT97745.1 DUF4398 domain-containing protein [Sideroxydans sp.]
MKTSTNNKTQTLIAKLGIVIGSAALLAACAGVQPPLEQMATSKAAVDTAVSTGANEFAPVQIKSAMEKMTRAEKAMSDENYEAAKQQAEQAQVDAQLATAMARSAKAKKAADALQEDSQILRQELDRKSN